MQLLLSPEGTGYQESDAQNALIANQQEQGFQGANLGFASGVPAENVPGIEAAQMAGNPGADPQSRFGTLQRVVIQAFDAGIIDEATKNQLWRNLSEMQGAEISDETAMQARRTGAARAKDPKFAPIE
jgi:hypothetical protein